MKTITFLLSASIVFSCSDQESWTSLLDKELSQWEIYQSYRLPVDYNGDVPLDTSGQMIQPIGFNINENEVFSIVEENGHPVLRISGEIYGCLFTKQEFENYHLKLKVKWGEIKWDPRKDKLRDSGVLYHSIGAPGIDYWRSWMLSQEMQIMEGHMGDYWSIANSAINVRAYMPEGIMNSLANHEQEFLPVGAGTDLDGYCLRSENHESFLVEWTTVELICFGDKSLHLVNGQVVMVLQNSRYVEDGHRFPLTKRLML